MHQFVWNREQYIPAAEGHNKDSWRYKDLGSETHLHRHMTMSAHFGCCMPGMARHVARYHSTDALHAVESMMQGPLASSDWVQDVHPTEDFILVIDADMIMRQPFDPVALGAGPGWAISAFFTYMKGVSNELAMRHVPQVIPRNDTLAGQPGRRGDQVGGFTLMHTKDLERVAPLWLSFTTAVRNDPTVSSPGQLATHSAALLVSACTCLVCPCIRGCIREGKT